MALITPFERLQQLIMLLDRNPPIKQIVKFLSKHLDPLGEISGISWMTLNNDDFFDYHFTAGLRTKMDPAIRVAISDDNAVAESLRLGRMQIWDMEEMFSNYTVATHKPDLEIYPTGIALPLSESVVVGCALNSTREDLSEYEGYFECIRLMLALWQARIAFNHTSIARKAKEIGRDLTKRQGAILEMIREGKTNQSISLEIGFSESLVRQETIIIHKKLGVSGRKQLI